MNSDPVNICVIHEPNDLIGEELAIILRGQVGFCGFGGVKLETFTNSLPQDVQSRVGFHDLCHGLLDQRLASWEPVTIATEIQ